MLDKWGESNISLFRVYMKGVNDNLDAVLNSVQMN